MSLSQLLNKSKMCLSRFALVASISTIPIGMQNICGQIHGKNPDRSVYQPPLLVIGDEGSATLLKAGAVADLNPAPRPTLSQDRSSNAGDKKSGSRSGGKAQSVAQSGLGIQVETNVSLSPTGKDGRTIRSASYGHLPRPVLSEDEQARNILGRGEEGNRHRPLMEVSLERASQNHGDGTPDDSQVVARERSFELADLIRSTAEEHQTETQPTHGSNAVPTEFKQVSHEEDAPSKPPIKETKANATGVANAESRKEASLSQGVIRSSSNSSSLDQLTRFATLPLVSHAIGQPIGHDSTCDGCEACDSGACDSIGCGVFGCEDCDVECDTLGCDAIGGRGKRSLGSLHSLKQYFSSASCRGQGATRSNETPWFGGVEYLMMWRRGVRLPSLLTTEVTNSSGTEERTLVGNDRIMTRMTSGVRLTTGRWMNRDQTIGLVGRGWYGGRKEFDYTQDQSQTATLLRPFLDFTDQFTPSADTQVIAEPDRADGSVSINGDSEAFGVDLSFRRFLGADYGATMDLLYGYQFVRFNERLDIQTNSVSLDDDFAPIGSTFDVRDSFQTSNEFHGAQLGLQTEYRESFWSFQGLAKLAFGSLRREALRTGETTVRVDTLTSTEAEGLLVQETNRGRITNQHFSWVPEIEGTLGWHRYQGWDLTLGYHLLAVTDAIQPCGAIDPDLGVNLSDPFVGASRPSADLRYRTFYLHGIHFGLQRVY